jgi:hypothetical protein
MVWFKASADEGAAELDEDRTNDPVGAAQIDCAADEALAMHCDTIDDETDAVQELAEADDDAAAI